MKTLARAIATTAFLGLRVPAPGTFAGSLPALIIYWLLFPAAIMKGPGAWIGVAIAVLITAIGIWAAGVAEEAYGHDAGPIVVDEVAGQWISLLFLPKTIVVAVAAFIFFRIFDIVKPFPAGRAQNLPGGWGIMVDDVAAAVYANLATQVVAHFLSR